MICASLCSMRRDARHLHLEWDNRIAEPLSIDGPAVRQITLNLLLNACAASPDGGLVAVAMSPRRREAADHRRRSGSGAARGDGPLAPSICPSSRAWAGEQGARIVDHW